MAPPDGTAAQLNFILVADQWRRQGVATSLITACRIRWPALQLTGPMDKAGEGLLRSRTEFYTDDLDDQTGPAK